MSLFVLGTEEKETLRILREHAENNVFSIETLLEIKSGIKPPVGDTPGYSMDLPVGYKVTYSIEDQEQIKKKFRHLSVSCNGKLPSVESVKLIMENLGYQNILTECDHVYPEKEDGLESINILEEIKQS